MDFLKTFVLPFVPAIYGVALVGTHVFHDNTIAYKVCQWFVSGAGAFGKTPQAPQA